MAQADHAYITSRFHNLSNAALADALGYADAVLKGAEAESKSLKDEFKRRNLMAASGENFTVTATEQISGRLDSKAVKEFLRASCTCSWRAVWHGSPQARKSKSFWFAFVSILIVSPVFWLQQSSMNGSRRQLRLAGTI
jgi:hypothetical protein